MQPPGSHPGVLRLQGFSGLDGDTPLLVQLLQQYTALANHQPTQPFHPGTNQQPAAAAVSYSQPTVQQHIQDVQASQQQQQLARHSPAAEGLSPASALQMAAAVKQPSKSASIMEEIDMDENLINTWRQDEPDEDEEYTAVFVSLNVTLCEHFCYHQAAPGFGGNLHATMLRFD